ncbi:DUF397 domain-containing protein [Asanoa sp. NPDC050611]|uniref:DUF397 domain-containing protein n=1 Tax=Asanoa sp. NPDC050611 TaxID=3157098 RepID=UPI00340D5DC7
MTELTAHWKKSSKSAQGNCVEARLSGPNTVEIRDSKLPNGPSISIPSESWTAFINATKSPN